MKKSEEKLLKQVLENLPDDHSSILNLAKNHNKRNLKTAMEVLEATEKQNEDILKKYREETKIEIEKQRLILKDYDKELKEKRDNLINKYGYYDINGSKFINDKNENYAVFIKEQTILIDSLREKYAKKLAEYEKAAKKVYAEMEEKYKDDIAKYEKAVEELKPEYEKESDFIPYVFNEKIIENLPLIPSKDLYLLQECGIIPFE